MLHIGWLGCRRTGALRTRYMVPHTTIQVALSHTPTHYQASASTSRGSKQRFGAGAVNRLGLPLVSASPLLFLGFLKQHAPTTDRRRPTKAALTGADDCDGLPTRSANDLLYFNRTTGVLLIFQRMGDQVTTGQNPLRARGLDEEFFYF